MKKLKVADNYVLLEPLKEGEEERSGLIIVKLGDGNLKRGKIIEVGRVTDNTDLMKSFPSLTYNTGETAFFMKGDGIELEYDNKKYIIVNYKGIIATIGE